ncbi:hypothetical protein JCM19232_2643 [Vibrio ishigakensis]|uniref:Uncharacterized protein n=1 Tax=Vibrio ishigakensis TaxID=1481914 RepID=A0A0B8PKM3_9VIBR|nr:hypothetical protein JCM19232_2643 [Vibrio ishigakensis]
MDFWKFCASSNKEGDAGIEVELQILEKCLTGWSNIKDSDGESVVFKQDRDHIIKYVPVVHCRALVQKIVALSVLADDELKN